MSETKIVIGGLVLVGVITGVTIYLDHKEQERQEKIMADFDGYVKESLGGRDLNAEVSDAIFNNSELRKVDPKDKAAVYELLKHEQHIMDTTLSKEEFDTALYTFTEIVNALESGDISQAMTYVAIYESQKETEEKQAAVRTAENIHRDNKETMTEALNTLERILKASMRYDFLKS